MARKPAPKDPLAVRAALEKTLATALENALDGTPRPLQGTPASGALFPSGAKGTPLVEAATVEGFIEIVDPPKPSKPPRRVAPRYARITERGRQWVLEKGSPLNLVAGLRDLLTSQGSALNASVEETQNGLAELVREVARLQQTIQEQVGRYQQASRALIQVLTQTKPASTGSTPWLEDAVRLVGERKRHNSLTRPTLPQLYEELRKLHPGLSLAQYHDGLRVLHLSRRIILGAYTQALATLPDHQNALYLDKEVKFYVDLP